MSTDTSDISAGNGASLLPPYVHDFLEQFKHYDEDDARGVLELRQWFRARPELLHEVWSMSQQALQALISTAYAQGEMPLNRTCLEETLRQLGQDLSGENPSALERLMIQAVLYSWLAYYTAEYGYQHGRSRLSERQEAFHLKRITRLHRRFLADIRTLAQLRKIGFPHVQINVADQQIVTGG